MQLLQENAELQRANRLLTALTSSSKSSSHYELLQTELRVAEARTKDLEAMLQGQNVDLTLVEEKRHLQHLNLALSEKVSALQAREARTLSRLHDVKEQAELLEFRVLELEEERERVCEAPFCGDFFAHTVQPCTCTWVHARTPCTYSMLAIRYERRMHKVSFIRPVCRQSLSALREPSARWTLDATLPLLRMRIPPRDTRTLG